MHVAFFVPSWPAEDFQNGIVTYVKHMRLGLLERGHRVTVVTGELGPSNHDQDVAIVAPSIATRFLQRVRGRLGLSSMSDFGQSIRDTLRRIHERDPIDVIEMEESFGWFDELRKMPISIVVKLHGPAFLSLVEEERNEPLAVLRMKREGDALSRARFITAPSVSTATDTVERYGLSVRVAHARNPIDALALQQWDSEKADADTAIFVGRFDKRKGADIVLQAFKLVLSKKPDARLIFVGRDHGIAAHDGSLTKFEEYAARLFTPTERARITFSGQQEPRAVEQLRLKARVTIVASRWENAPYAATEALGQGCPVAAMDCPGVNEVVLSGETGLLSTDTAGLAENMLTLLSDVQMGKRLGSAGRQFILQTHSSTVAVDFAVAVYAKAMASPRS